MRGCAIELRMQIPMGVWKSFFDGLFFFSSALLAIFYGAALANVIRGVPIQPDGYFFLPLWTDWRVGPQPGILDWYTVIGGLIALIALGLHGALYIAVKTEGALQLRARKAAGHLWIALLVFTMLSLPASVIARADMLSNYRNHPLAYVIPLVVVFSLLWIRYFNRSGADRNAFACSCMFLATMLVGAAVGLYPRLLPATTGSANDITIQNAISGSHTLHVGLIWWSVGTILAIGYFVLVYRMFRGKVSLQSGGYEH
jgi:cytochrome d ubiquinol oxidase subunit II